MRSMEIQCGQCGTAAIARAEAVYEGFRRTGTRYICTECGKCYASEEETPFIHAAAKPDIFGDDDKPDLPSIFKDDERRKCCSWCRHFIINPFAQRCGLANRETEATDLCARFEAKTTPPPAHCSLSPAKQTHERK